MTRTFPGTALLACLLVVATGCGTDLESPKATTVLVTPGTAALTFLGQSAAFVATVSDQFGNEFAGTVSWTSDAPSVFTVNSAGVANAVGNGAGTVRAEVDGVSGTATVTVSQTPAAVERIGGDGQRGPPGMPLNQPLVARILDAGGSPIAGAVVFFAPADGSGFVNPATAPTDMAGEVQTSWTLGEDFGLQSVVASVAHGANTVFTGTAQRPNELADSLEIVSGDGQAAPPGKGLRRPIVLRVLDEHHAPVEGATVLFDAPPGHGFADPASVGTDRDGEAATTWTLGDKLGLQLLTASVPGGPSARIEATGSEGVCGRTRQVRDELMVWAGVSQCEEVTPDMLARIIDLDLAEMSITALKTGDFEGLLNLEGLSLDRNQLDTLPVDVFDGLTELIWLGLSQNQLSALPVGIFDDLTRLIELQLRFNQLSVLPPGVFRRLAKLERLLIDANPLQLRAGDFAGLSNLQSLLASAKQSTLPIGVFSGLSNLQSLDLGSRELAELPVGVFSELTNLRSLDLSAGKLTELAIGVFSGLHKLEKLRLGSAELAEIPAGVFGGLSVLDTLSLSGKLPEIPADALSELPSLRALYLNASELRTLPGGVFSGLSSDLQSLVVSGSPMRELPPGALDGLANLEVLGLNDNHLSTLPSSVFHGLPNLEYLGLQGNQLGALPGNILGKLSGLRGLEISYNQLTHLPADIFSGLARLEVVLAHYNRLSTLPANLFSGLGQLSWLWLNENPGSPFPLTLRVERTDTTNLAAPGPATLVVTVHEGAPFDMQVNLSANDATLSPPTVTIPTGATRSNTITVTVNSGVEGPVTVSLGALPKFPEATCPYTGRCYTGIVIKAGDPIKLFK